jgi:hypothetical protein
VCSVGDDPRDGVAHVIPETAKRGVERRFEHCLNEIGGLSVVPLQGRIVLDRSCDRANETRAEIRRNI